MTAALDPDDPIFRQVIADAAAEAKFDEAEILREIGAMAHEQNEEK
jgi:hypothetical protein